jgi:hypothetical protein
MTLMMVMVTIAGPAYSSVLAAAKWEWYDHALPRYAES